MPWALTISPQEPITVYIFMCQFLSLHVDNEFPGHDKRESHDPAEEEKIIFSTLLSVNKRQILTLEKRTSLLICMHEKQEKNE